MSEEGVQQDGDDEEVRGGYRTAGRRYQTSVLRGIKIEVLRRSGIFEIRSYTPLNE